MGVSKKTKTITVVGFILAVIASRLVHAAMRR